MTPARPASFVIRGSTFPDLPFLREMLYEAAFWRVDQPRPSIEQGLADPELSKLLDNWGRDGDAAVVAIAPDGTHIGAAWYRFWSDDDHSYGFVNSSIPELGMGVVLEYRGRGVGDALLAALKQLAASSGVSTLSLSVEKDNRALHLYERHGFTQCGEVGNAWTMVVNLQ